MTLHPSPDYGPTALLAVCRVVGVEDLLLDPASSVDLHPLGLSPCSDLRDVITGAGTSSTSRPARSQGHDRPVLHCATGIDELLEHGAEPLCVLLGQIDLIFLAINGVRD